jgi:hypothetical protein
LLSFTTINIKQTSAALSDTLHEDFLSMPDITITDSIHATVGIEFKDASPLGLAKLSGLKFSSLPIIGDFTKPINQCSLQHAEFGPTFISPSLLLSNEATLTVKEVTTGELSIRQGESKTLFEDDGFCPQIPILPGECWIGLDLQLQLTATAGATFNGFGVAAEGSSTVGVGTYVLLKSESNSLPSLRGALKTALEDYSAIRTATAILGQKIGIAYTLDTGGSIKFSGSYSLPISVNPLASASLPFNYTISLDPDVTVRIGGQIVLNGQFIVRSYKVSETELIFGVYKKKDTTLAATFQAGVGLRASIGETDIVAAFLGTVFPAVDPAAAGFSEEQGEVFKAALTECVDSSLSVAVNASCSASNTDESALVYSIKLSNGDAAKTENAVHYALRGDWTLLASLPNATELRNVCREMHKRKHTIAVNLLGFYNAGAVTDYIKSCTILHDASGQVVLIDEASAKHVAVSGIPYLADAEKLRTALAEGFIATVTYGASVTGSLKLKNFAVQQNYVYYKAQMPGHDLRSQLLLGRALHLIPDGVWNAIQGVSAPFRHVKIWINARYDAPATLRLFFSDPATQTSYSRQHLESIGRKAKIALLGDAGARVSALQNDTMWEAMTRNGNIAAFKTLPEFRNFSPTDMGAIAADWYDIIWWAEAMLAVEPVLSQVLQASDTAGSPNRKMLEDALANASALARSAFGDGWGLLTMFLLSGGAPTLDIDIAWNGKFQHFSSQVMVAMAGA